MQELTYKWTYLFSKVNAKAITKQIAIAIGFAAAYWAINAANPILAKSFLVPFGFTFRFANLLKPFVLVLGPAAVLGMSVGSAIFSWQVGAFPIVPLVVLPIGLAIVSLSKKWGRSTAKDITLLLLYGILSGIVSAAQQIGFAAAVSPEFWQPFLLQAVVIRIGIHAIVYPLGYPLIRGWEGIVNGKSNSSK